MPVEKTPEYRQIEENIRKSQHLVYVIMTIYTIFTLVLIAFGFIIFTSIMPEIYETGTLSNHALILTITFVVFNIIHNKAYTYAIKEQQTYQKEMKEKLALVLETNTVNDVFSEHIKRHIENKIEEQQENALVNRKHWISDSIKHDTENQDNENRKD